MCPIKYYDIMQKSKDKKFIRYQMVNHATLSSIESLAVRKTTGVWIPALRICLRITTTSYSGNITTSIIIHFLYLNLNGSSDLL